MKITFIPKVTKRVFLPLIAATTLTATSMASTKQTENIDKYELISKDVFEHADINEDNVLSYSEFLNIRDINTKKEKPSRTFGQEEQNKKNLYGMVFLALIVAAIGIVKDIQNDNKENKKDSLF